MVDGEHYNSLSGSICALESSTIRLPIVERTRAEVQNVKDVISSVVDVMQAMGSSMCSLLPTFNINLTLLALSTNPWRMGFKQKKVPHFKKWKPKPPPGGSYGPAYKFGSYITTYSMGKPSASPLSSPPEPSDAPASPFGNVILLKGQIIVDDMIPTQTMTKATSSDKEIPSKVTTSSSQDKVGHKSHTGATSTGLHSMLISLLMENQSKGGLILRHWRKLLETRSRTQPSKLSPL